MARYDTSLRHRDTIYACATAPGRAAISVLRISGSRTCEILERLTRNPVSPPRYAALRKLFDPASGDVLDHALVLRFVAPASYTGEDSAELHLHGAPVVVRAVSETLDAMGVRLADSGEFSARAFENGKLKGDQIEGLAELIDAQTDGARRLGLRALEGEVGRKIGRWRNRLLECAALIETGIDFSDEDIGEDVLRSATADLTALAGELRAELHAGATAGAVYKPITIAIFGPPNAGKSSLLNQIMGKDAAIVSDQAGTTRDPVTVHGALEGLEFELIDTAGYRTSPDRIEAEGVRRAVSAAETADRRVLVVSPDTSPVAADLLELVREGDCVFWNKADLQAAPRLPAPVSDVASVYAVSTLDGSAVEAFSKCFQNWRRDVAEGASVVTSTTRRKEIVGEVVSSLDCAIAALTAGGFELGAAEVKLAAGELGRVVGSVDGEEIFDIIFSRFCIGK